MQNVDVFLQIVGACIGLVAATWAYLKFVYRIKENFFYITNCSILPLSLWDDVVKEYNVKKRGQNDHAFRPLIIIPRAYNNYFKIKNGKKAILEFRTPDSNRILATAEVFWVPKNSRKWKSLRHPAVSLVLRRYFGIERPLFQEENKVPEGWVKIVHGKEDLRELHHDAPDDSSKVIWAVSKKYSYRFFNPLTKKYSGKYADGSYIEYCGLSLKVRKKSIFVIDIN